MEEITRRLKEKGNAKSAAFSHKLIPTVSAERFLGLKTPDIRAIATEFRGTKEAEEFLRELPHYYYEENGLHALLIMQLRDYAAALAAVEAFLPYIDNWAVCDTLSPKVFAKHIPEVAEKSREWIVSDRVYTVRFGIEMLMSHCLGEYYEPWQPELIAGIRSDEYYIRMMVAWYFATALAKRWDDFIPFIEGRKLDDWTHNKAIQKSVESYRITDVQKEYLRTLKIQG